MQVGVLREVEASLLADLDIPNGDRVIVLDAVQR